VFNRLQQADRKRFNRNHLESTEFYKVLQSSTGFSIWFGPGGQTTQINTYRSLKVALTSIARSIEEYNHDRPHRVVKRRTPHAAFLAFATDLSSEALSASIRGEPANDKE
jgi:transposase InsO family protein